ncbi:MAG: V-type ATPase subunit [Clostridia bacterium]|nr:V-type ATPase subunit [Clostridia bacterium]
MKRDIDYAYAVTRVRANEVTLLSQMDLDQLINADSYKSAMRKLADAGWGDIEGVTETKYAEYIENYFKKHWDLLVEILKEDIKDLDLLLIKNDMQNLKAALKGIISEHAASDLYAKSTVYDTKDILAAVEEREFRNLPEFMQDPAIEAYEILTTTGNGQLADAVIDKATLEHILVMAKETKVDMLMKIAERMVATANIKTALRCASTKKSADFISRSIAECETLDKQALVAAAASGSVDEVLAYVDKTVYVPCVEEFKKSTSAFEKWCDDLLMECVSGAKFEAFGIAPIIAYYIARDAEVKTVRIILSAKVNNIPADIIRERVRTLYV